MPFKTAAVFSAGCPWWPIPRESTEAAESRVQALPEGVAVAFRSLWTQTLRVSPHSEPRALLCQRQKRGSEKYKMEGIWIVIKYKKTVEHMANQ